MTEQHRATADEWASVKSLAFAAVTYSCILELLHRIEALEARNEDDWVQQCLAAALEAVTDEAMSPVPPPCKDFDEYAQGFLAAHVKYRSELLAIAAKLRGDTTPTETP